VIIISTAGDFDVSGGSFFSSSYSSAYYIVEAEDYYNKVTLASDGTDAYASLYLPFSVTIPSGITAYTVTEQDGTYAHMEPIVTGGTLPKNTAAILKKVGQDNDETIYLSPAENAGSNSTTPYVGFGGTIDTTPCADTGSTYVLGRRSSTDSEETVNIGLYNYTGTNLAKGKAYLFVAGGSAKALVFDFGDIDDETGIGCLTPTFSEGEGTAIYNLSGQRLNKMQKGINIVNGKKVLF
jgi:hypothetical protein